jgi:hypothetical protein
MVTDKRPILKGAFRIGSLSLLFTQAGCKISKFLTSIFLVTAVDIRPGKNS